MGDVISIFIIYLARYYNKVATGQMKDGIKYIVYLVITLSVVFM